ncbi:MAG: hypothetical protein ACREM3_17230 [Candidatus Rokuibacteriota bacterium]
MAGRDFRFERHSELWKEETRHLARWAVGLALFASLALVKVLVPYVGFSDQLAGQQGELKAVHADLATIEAERVKLQKVDRQLQAVRAVIERQKPWMTERDRLIETLRDLQTAHRRLHGASPELVLQALRESGHASPVNVQQAAMAAPTRLVDHQSIQPGMPTRVTRSLAGDAALLGLQADRLAGVASPQAFRQLLDEQLQRRIQEAADDKVRRIVERVNEAVIQPVERLVSAEPGATEVIRPGLASLRAEMDRWAREHIGSRAWYETIQQKDRELRELTESLRVRQAAFDGLVKAQEEALKARERARAERQRRAEAQVAGIEKVQARLRTEMQKLLPDLIGGFVSVEEILQLYPLALLGLVGVVAFKAGLVRHHYLVVREGYRARTAPTRDAAMSSLWTLVDRGPLGTAVTAVVYLGGTVLCWWLFERGCGLTQAWLPGHPEATWGWIAAWLPAVRWVGRLVFGTLLIAVPVLLVRDWTTRPGDGQA